MRGIHGYDQCERRTALFLFREELNGTVYLIFRSPFMGIEETVARSGCFPIHRIEVIVIRAVSYPEVETMSAFGGTPFIPCRFSAVVVGIHIGFVG